MMSRASFLLVALTFVLLLYYTIAVSNKNAILEEKVRVQQNAIEALRSLHSDLEEVKKHELQAKETLGSIDENWANSPVDKSAIRLFEDLGVYTSKPTSRTSGTDSTSGELNTN